MTEEFANAFILGMIFGFGAGTILMAMLADKKGNNKHD